MVLKHINTKGSALVIWLSPPRSQERGTEKLSHTPEPRLGVVTRHQAQCAFGGPTDAEPNATRRDPRHCA